MSKSDDVLNWLDRSVQWTGIPALAQGRRPFPRYHLRWTSLIWLAAATAGLVVAWSGAISAPLGYFLVLVLWSISGMIPIFGPLKPWGSSERTDEFDRAARSRAFFFAFAGISMVAVFGSWLLVALIALDQWPREQVIWTLAGFSFYLMTLFNLLPTLHASWATRPIGEED